MSARFGLVCVLSLSACSLSPLFDRKVVTEPCFSQEDCRGSEYDGDPCVVVSCDPRTNECVGALADGDGDLHAPTECTGYPSAFPGVADDCNDDSEDGDEDGVADGFQIVPGAVEICNGIDDDCDGEEDEDPDASASCNDFPCNEGRCEGTGIVRIAAGCDHTCALRENGSVVCWGENDAGQLGVSRGGFETRPVTVEGIRDAVALAAGMSHTCIVRRTGEVACWGENGQAQVGEGTPLEGLSEGAEITAGFAHNCVRDGASVQCWGWNEYGQLGDGTIGGQRANPMPVEGLSDAVEVVAGAGGPNGFEPGVHTCARREDGTVACWGWNGFLQLGAGKRGDAVAVPEAVPGVSAALDLSSNGYHTCAIVDRKTAPEVVCWGWGGLGTEDRPTLWSVPETILGTAGAEAVSAGLHHTCALSGSRVLCWGASLGDEFGQIGDGPDHGAGSATAAEARGLVDAVEVVTGCGHSCARRSSPDGPVVCWGHNDRGQLGNGRTTDALAPLAVVDL